MLRRLVARLSVLAPALCAGTRILTGAAVLTGAALFPSPAMAAAPGQPSNFDTDSVNYDPPAPVRRRGFALGLTSGYGLGTYAGYDLSVDALNDPNQRQTTGPTIASNIGLWIGVAPRDWLAVGLGFNMLSAQGNGLLGAGGALMAHVEGFPLFELGGQFENLGIGLNGGIGMVNLVDIKERDFKDPLATSGSLSTLGFEAFWEPFYLWHLSTGPTLNYTHGFSQTMHVNQITLGLRIAWYGVQPEKPEAR